MYQMTDGVYQLEGVGEYRSYGLIRPSGVRMDDITIERDRMERFVELLNRLEASEVHILELVDDFIVSPLLA